MPNIRSSADLRNNYNEISTYCHEYDEPVFITKNGKGDLAVMSIETYEEMLGRFELYSRIQKGMQDIENNRIRPLSQVIDDLKKEKKIMNWNIYVTEEAEEDLISAVDYIDSVLKNPIAATRLIEEAEKQFQLLSINATLNPIISDEVLKSWKIRFIKVNNYLAFYRTDEVTKTVYIIRFLYGKSNWNSILKRTSHF